MGGVRMCNGDELYHLSPSQALKLVGYTHPPPPPSSRIPTLILQVRSMTNDLGQAITAAGPSIAVQVGLGFRV